MKFFAAPIIGALLMLTLPITASASELFVHSYKCESGSDYAYELGQPTTYTGTVQADVYSLNIRADKNVADAPPSYGIFSGEVATDPTNPLFTQPVNPAYWTTYPQTDPNAIPVYDTLQMGANTPAVGNPMNIYNVMQDSFLSPTSIE